jgi:predicted dehydrogenase
MEPIRVGIIGLGRSGWNIHAHALTDREDYRVVAVADPLPERRTEAAEKFGCAVYELPERLIADPNVELVVVAAPSAQHGPLAEAAVKAGKHVLVEKPFAQSVAEAEAVFRAAQSAGKVAAAFQNRRFDADLAKIQEVIASGTLGEIFQIRIGHYGFARRADWQTLRKFGGGMLSNWGPHIVDLSLLLLEDLEPEVFAQLRRVASAGDAEDHVRLTLRARTGRIIDIELAICAFPQPQWLIMGSYGTLEGSGRELRLKYYDPAAVPPLEADEGAAAGRRYGTGEVLPWQEETITVTSSRSPDSQYYDALYRTLREGEPALVTPAQTLAQMRIMEEARRQSPL